MRSFAEVPDDDDRHRLGQRIVEQRLDELGGVGDVGVDEDEVGRVGARELERGLRVVGPLALERARAGDERLRR